jgi:uncharacterized protein GlcG (DUF336 family)
MTTDRLALATVLRDNGIGDQRKAEAVATAIFDAIHDSVATKADIAALTMKIELAATKADLAAFRTIITSEIARLDTRIERLDATVKAQPNAIVLRIGALAIVVAGALFAALRYWPHG